MSEVPVHRQEALLTSLDYVLNTERKIALGAVLLAGADTTHTPTSLRQDFHECQGNDIVWDLASGDCITFMSRNFIPAGVVIEPSHRSYELNMTDAEEALLGSEIGFLAMWSKEYPEFSVQDAFGPTRTRGRIRSPRGRFQIYDHLFSREGPYYYENIVSRYKEFGYKTRESFAGQFDALKDLGIIVTENEDHYDPLLKVVRKKPNLSKARPVTQNAYEHSLDIPEGTHIRLEELLQSLEGKLSRDDLAEMRKAMRNSLNSHSQYTNFVLAGIAPGESMPEIVLAEEFYEPLHALYHGLKRIAEKGPDRNHLAFMNALVHGEDRSVFRDLLAKGKDFSKHTYGEDFSIMRDKIITLLQDSPDSPVYAQEVRQALLEDPDRKSLSTVHVLNILNTLVSDGWLDYRREYRGTRTTSSAYGRESLRKMNVYWLSESARRKLGI